MNADKDPLTPDTFYLDIAQTRDSSEIPLVKYITLPLDYGQPPGADRIARGFILRIAWIAYLLPIFFLTSIVNTLLKFEWVTWVTGPVLELLDSVRNLLGQTGIISLGLAVSALVIGVGFARRRYGPAIVEFIIVAVIAGIALSSPISKPEQYISGSESWINQSKDFGNEAAAATIGSPNPKAPVSASIVDLTVGIPAQVVSFGQVLEGECRTKFIEGMRSGKDPEGIRKDVTGCSETAKKGNETNDLAALILIGIYGWSTSGVMLLLAVFAFFVIREIFLAILSTLNVLLRSYLAVFPGGRGPFLNAFGMLIVNIVLIAIYLWFCTAYLWLMTRISQAVSPGYVIAGNMVITVGIIMMVVTFFKARKQGKKLSDVLSRAVARMGLGKDRAPAGPSKILSNAGKAYKSVQLTRLGNSRNTSAQDDQGDKYDRTSASKTNAPNPPRSMRGPGLSALSKAALGAAATAATGGVSPALLAAGNQLAGQAAVTAAQGAITAAADPREVSASTTDPSTPTQAGATTSAAAPSISPVATTEGPGINASAPINPSQATTRQGTHDGNGQQGSSPGSSDIPITGKIVDSIPANVKRVNSWPHQDQQPANTSGATKSPHDTSRLKDSVYRLTPPAVPDTLANTPGAMTSGGINE
ncbi:hypothetical protein [Acaricomes phytoseiuli]|uniref:hypothetical protein n=1 Tax=Acaricomes phytoseiuli TaxID=291968 RepID=UPI0012E9D7AE|nr:hypothetical protein [Acaricomes phytoseiuli]